MERAVTTKTTQLNPVLGDRMLNETSDDAVMHTSLAQEVAQRIFVRLHFWVGEWFLNLESGSPYREHILRKGTQDRVIRAVFGAIINGTEGVDRMTKFSYQITALRELQLTFECRLVDGNTFKSSDYAAFVVTQ